MTVFNFSHENSGNFFRRNSFGFHMAEATETVQVVLLSAEVGIR